MMTEIKAYKCAMTGSIFECERDARRSEFRAMVRQIGGAMGAMGSVNSIDIMEWLARNMEGGIYPNAIDKFIAAAKYLEEHRDTLAFVKR